MLRWSIRDLCVVTGAVAAGICVAKLDGNDAVGFCFGALTAFMAVGLAQQILFPAEPVDAGRIPVQGRRVCLGLILFCMVLAICGTYFGDLVPASPRLEQVAHDAYTDRVAAYLRIARALWICSLMLGALTAPGMVVATQAASTKRRRWARLGVSVVFVACFLCYVGVVLLWDWTAHLMMVDVAIHGVYSGAFQGPAVGSPHYIEWFGRSPQQLDEFVRWQVFSWPLLLLALVLTISRSQSRDRSVAGTVFTAIIVISLVTPAAINAIWLSGGAASHVLPVMIAESPPGLAMSVWPFLLLALYLTTRRVVVVHASPSPDRHRAYWSDHVVVGWLFVAIGVCAVVDSSNSAASTFKTLIESLAHPQYGAALVFLTPYGFYWLWRRRQAGGSMTGRWPQIGMRQLLLFPCILGLLLSTVALSIPFGIAAWYFGT